MSDPVKIEKNINEERSRSLKWIAIIVISTLAACYLKWAPSMETFRQHAANDASFTASKAKGAALSVEQALFTEGPQRSERPSPTSWKMSMSAVRDAADPGVADSNYIGPIEVTVTVQPGYVVVQNYQFRAEFWPDNPGSWSFEQQKWRGVMYVKNGIHHLHGPCEVVMDSKAGPAGIRFTTWSQDPKDPTQNRFYPCWHYTCLPAD